MCLDGDLPLHKHARARANTQHPYIQSFWTCFFNLCIDFSFSLYTLLLFLLLSYAGGGGACCCCALRIGTHILNVLCVLLLPSNVDMPHRQRPEQSYITISMHQSFCSVWNWCDRIDRLDRHQMYAFNLIWYGLWKCIRTTNTCFVLCCESLKEPIHHVYNWINTHTHSIHQPLQQVSAINCYNRAAQKSFSLSNVVWYIPLNIEIRFGLVQFFNWVAIYRIY